ncbi:MAG: DUF763 domain-containing protein [Candidatus Odinarchaeia archaeon]
MKRTGLATLPLHHGKAPHWLVSRMIRLSDAIFEVLLDEFGPEEILRRLADPFWFQCLACVLAYDWHSSGTTTVTMGVLKSVFNSKNYGIVVLGGKGIYGRRTQSELDELGGLFGFGESKINELKKISKLTAKIDNAAIQDGFQIYHHTMVVCEKDWAVIQQGMDTNTSYARRYHWLSSTIKDYTEAPHSGIISSVSKNHVLNMVDKKSREARKTTLDLVKDNPKHLKRYLRVLRDPPQKTLFEDFQLKTNIPVLNMPRRIDWNAMEKAYELQPSKYEELLLVHGFGPAAIRALALISTLIWGVHPSWKDPVKFTFAHGGKDGVPYPVNRKQMEDSAQIFKQAIEESKLGKHDKLRMLKRLVKITDF